MADFVSMTTASGNKATVAEANVKSLEAMGWTREGDAPAADETPDVEPAAENDEKQAQEVVADAVAETAKPRRSRKADSE